MMYELPHSSTITLLAVLNLGGTCLSAMHKHQGRSQWNETPLLTVAEVKRTPWNEACQLLCTELSTRPAAGASASFHLLVFDEVEMAVEVREWEGRRRARHMSAPMTTAASVHCMVERRG
eukprot:TRINITY_DN1638_c0_g1_i3.p2 TRINITY_DN1638_c0_g1~~TRINITY_DN1638_c0_g1_i3.p2  ORF type:complete len:120 (+),score=19.31 TRINITY_DN1638_c0_g1_i3:366-725(+)